MVEISSENFWIYRLTGLTGFIGIFICAHYDRVGVATLKKLFKLKLKSKSSKKLTSIASLLLGLSILGASLAPSLIEGNYIKNVLGIVFTIVITIMLRVLVVKSKFSYFERPDL